MTLEVRWLDALSGVEGEHWDALHDGSNPFVGHAFLSGLESTGCIRADWGWTPRHLTLWERGRLVAAAPGYLKHNSHGEFVFDHAWAHAHARAGLDYFPKYLCAVPYSPVGGPRLLAADPAHRPALLAAMTAWCEREGLSSAHVNFHSGSEAGSFGPDWLARHDIQYHWENRDGWRDFDDFLAAMDSKHRKNIRRERARLAASGVAFRVVHGDEASESDLASMHALYLQTFAEYGNHPALSLAFFRHLARALPRHLVLVLADVGAETLAGALCLRGGDTLYGRYWGCHATLPGLHFETCYYQGIEYCLREGLRRFEPGAQGEHKLARGFRPRLVHSRHWIADPVFRDALAGWCREESELVEQHAAALSRRLPFKTDDAPA
ncbi:GNAT family N-acetyltransferase [Marilutibacter aestuarii]|uniref:GNAT family N-acetyltransferase n=1 Tax=Marilutibacter aestuarii TaxID=1706195 RepID=A0A507ZY39_9GAMM|nr:GNAT family N-acetyltransferase [Lysobacter aestuarii]TQD42616.1 GNAT family N-acetyltransferase [Lysobacter aestuarii]